MHGGDAAMALFARMEAYRMRAWTWLIPVVTILLLAAAGALAPVGPGLAALCAAGLGGAVIAAVHHAEVIAHRLGEPFGTLCLALAVTVIEASLILSMMVAGGAEMAVLPRDTIYAAIMIICNGVIGLCLLIGGIVHREQAFRVEGAGAGMAALVVMAALTLVLPVYTTSAPGGAYNHTQLWFLAVSSATLWAVFVFIQTVRHRDYFLPVDDLGADDHASLPSARAAWASFGWLLVSLVAVVGLAKVLSPTIEHVVEAAGAPRAVVGIAIALLVLLPESVAAALAARADRLQTSLNLAVGSALASIGLTIPVVVVAAVALDMPLTLGLDPVQLVLLILTFVVSAFTLVSGRTHMMQGVVHLVVFAAFLLMAVVP
jgi:Ca2+:H+ antiporter